MQRIGIAGVIAGVALLVGPAASGAAKQAASAKAYIVAELTVHDAAKFAQYAPQVPAILAKYGGHYIARGGAIVPLEGKAPTGRVVIIEFPSLEAAKAFNASAEYQAIVPLRQAASEGPTFIIQGVAP